MHETAAPASVLPASELEAKPTSAGVPRALSRTSWFGSIVPGVLGSRSLHAALASMSRLAVPVNAIETWAHLREVAKAQTSTLAQALIREPAASGRSVERLALRDMCESLGEVLFLTRGLAEVRADLLEHDVVLLPQRDTGLTRDMLREWASRPNDPHVRSRWSQELLCLVRATRLLLLDAKPLPRALGSGRSGWAAWLLVDGCERTLSEIESDGAITLWKRPRVPRASLVLARARAVLSCALFLECPRA